LAQKTIFRKCRLRKKNKIYDYEVNDEVIENKEEHFKMTYFLVILEQAINHWINVLKHWNHIQIILDSYTE